MTNPDITPAISSSDGKLKFIGFVLTGVWLAVVAIYTICERAEVTAMGPHDLADSLGGIFAPLAFLWLVLGYFQQGVELRHSVEALRLQSVELSHSVEQQRLLVEATREQIAQERQILAAEEAAAARAAAPLLRIRPSVMMANGMSVRTYTINNFGKECRNVFLEVSPIGIKQEMTSLHNNNFIQFQIVTARMEVLFEQTVIVSYVDQRNMPGEKRFVIPVAEDAEGADCFGEPYPID